MDVVDRIARSGLSYTEIGKRVGVSAIAVRYWATGKSQPTPDNLKRLDKALKEPKPGNGHDPALQAAPAPTAATTEPRAVVTMRQREDGFYDLHATLPAAHAMRMIAQIVSAGQS